MEPSQAEITELRTKFNQRVEEEKKEFHPKDISRVNNTNDWLRRFLIHHDLDIKDALSMLWDTCEWRKTNRVNEINEQNVNIEYLSEGSLFVHGRDKDGKSLFIFKCKKHVKGQKDFEELKKCVIYWFERVERQDKGNQITIFFDMADTGLANMDMEYTKYLINLCKLYYPHFLNYIIIFEMPWVLNAAFKIIKSWLPSKAVQKIKFVNRVSLKDYVEADQALKCWGGTDDYEFSFQPEPALSDGKVEENKKKVHFADGSPLSDNSPSSFGDSKQEEPSSKVKISPVDAIVFAQEGIEVLGNLSITNTSDSFISYKVKTTSPEKFRVRPSCGILAQGHTVNINVVVQPGYTGSNILRDKFLIMTFVIDHEGYSTNELNDLWKGSDSRKIDQHRLRCTVPGMRGATASHNGSPGATVHASTMSTQSPPDIDQKMSQLLLTVNHINECNAKLRSDLEFNQLLNWFIMAFVVFFGISLFYFMKTSDTQSHCHAPVDGFGND